MDQHRPFHILFPGSLSGLQHGLRDVWTEQWSQVLITSFQTQANISFVKPKQIFGFFRPQQISKSYGREIIFGFFTIFLFSDRSKVLAILPKMQQVVGRHYSHHHHHHHHHHHQLYHHHHHPAVIIIVNIGVIRGKASYSQSYSGIHQCLCICICIWWWWWCTKMTGNNLDVTDDCYYREGGCWADLEAGAKGRSGGWMSYYVVSFRQALPRPTYARIYPGIAWQNMICDGI